MAKRKKPADQLTPVPKAGSPVLAPAALLEDLRSLIRQAREGVAQAVNSTLVLLYWQIGHRIRTEILKQERASYGDEILSTLSNKLAAEFGNGFSQPNLSRMTRFADVFPDRGIVASKERGPAKKGAAAQFGRKFLPN